MSTEAKKHAIRKFSVGDRDLVSEFFGQMGGESRGFFNRGDGNKNDAMSFFDKPGDDKKAVRFLSSIRNEEGKEIMTGYVFAWDMDLRVPMLGIAVRDECKGQRLGRALIQHLSTYLEERGYGGVMLTVSAANMRGQGLYSRMGFQHFGIHTSGEMLQILRFRAL